MITIFYRLDKILSFYSQSHFPPYSRNTSLLIRELETPTLENTLTLAPKKKHCCACDRANSLCCVIQAT